LFVTLRSGVAFEGNAGGESVNVDGSVAAGAQNQGDAD